MGGSETYRYARGGNTTAASLPRADSRHRAQTCRLLRVSPARGQTTRLLDGARVHATARADVCRSVEGCPDAGVSTAGIGALPLPPQAQARHLTELRVLAYANVP